MKHKIIWIFIAWLVIVGLFEVPLTWEFTESVCMKYVIKGSTSFFLIVVVDLYIIASLIALGIAKYGIDIIDNVLFFAQGD